MTTYNGARYLRAQLDSLFRQSRLPDELIIADDASADTTVDLAAGCSASAPFPIRIDRRERNVGILDNFYAGFAAARGDIIFYCDQDDVWEPGKIARMLDMFDFPVALVMHQSRIVSADLKPDGTTAPGNTAYGRFAFPADSASVHGYGHQMAFRRPVLEVMRRLRPVAERIAPRGISDNLDQFIPFCAALLGDLVALPDTLVQFRRHDGATSSAGQRLGAEARATKLHRVIERDAQEADVRLQLATAAIDLGLVARSRAPRLIRAFEQRLRLCRSLRDLLHASSLRRRLALLGPVAATFWGGGFSNRRRLHDGGLAALALLLRTAGSGASAACPPGRPNAG